MEYHTCLGCAKSMRPAATPITEWPGTVLHGGFGYCYNCRKRQKKGRQVPSEVIPAEPLPPRELDPQELACLRLLERHGVADEMRAILGLDDSERPQPLTDIQMMRNGLQAPGGGIFGVMPEADPVVRRAIHTGSVKGRRL